jgi:oxalate decarboxylase/phosphoglucose isomerase-like protein (cupin superfamily)
MDILSPSASGITREEAPQVVPLAPPQVTAELVAGAVLVKWNGTGESLAQYEVYRKIAGAQDWTHMTNVQAREENTGSYQWRDTSTRPGTTYSYGITAVSSYGTKSSMVESAALTRP